MDTKCTSRCSTCGVLCDAFPITDVSSAQLYSGKGCTIIAGDLYIQNLPTSVTKKLLLDTLQSIRYIQGDLYFLGNTFISAMTFFSNLVGLYGAHYSNNAQLVDARMPALKQLSGAVTVEGCDRLCPARYTAVGAVPDDSGCPNPIMEYYVGIRGDVRVDQLWIVKNVLARVTVDKTNGGVCNCCDI